MGVRGSGIDSALWDIRGKVLNAPVWQLLGGKMRDELRLYWSHCGSIRTRWADRLGVPPLKTSDDLRRLCAEVREKGFTAIKTNLFPLKDRPDTVPLMSRLRHHAGDAPPDALRNADSKNELRLRIKLESKREVKNVDDDGALRIVEEETGRNL